MYWNLNWGIITSFKKLINSNMRCIETNSSTSMYSHSERLIVTWDVLKPISKTTVNNSSDTINSNMRCIETQLFF